MGIRLTHEERLTILTALETELIACKHQGFETADIQKLIERFRRLTGETAALRG